VAIDLAGSADLPRLAQLVAPRKMQDLTFGRKPKRPGGASRSARDHRSDQNVAKSVACAMLSSGQTTNNDSLLRRAH
jgi:hypothetical protein